MDPISAVGLVASIAQLGTGVAKTLSALNNFRKRYKEASFTVSLMIGQLSTIRAALDQVTEWFNSSSFDAPRHQQLIEDLSLAIDGCRMLMLMLENHVDRLGIKQDEDLGAWATMQHLWDEGSMKAYLDQLGHQTNALNLLLMAFQCRSLSRQQELLEKEESRSTIMLAVDSSSSIWVQHEADSSRHGKKASTSEFLTALDVDFDFDHELLHSKAYERTMISSMRQAIRQAPIAFRSDAQSINTESFQIIATPGTAAEGRGLELVEDPDHKDQAEKFHEGEASISLTEEASAPTGHVSIVITEIKDSAYWWEIYPNSMAIAVKLHNELVRKTLRSLHGYLVKRRQSDGFIIAFHSALEALSWCLMIQRDLMDISWPKEILNNACARQIIGSDNAIIFRGLDMRIAIHWGDPLLVNNPVTHRIDYIGPIIHWATSLNRLAEGGQVLASAEFIAQVLSDDDETQPHPATRALSNMGFALKVVTFPFPLVDHQTVLGKGLSFYLIQSSGLRERFEYQHLRDDRAIT